MTFSANQLTIIGVSGRRNKKVNNKCYPIYIEHTELPMIFLVVECISVDLLIGCNMLRLYKVNSELQHNKFVKDDTTYASN